MLGHDLRKIKYAAPHPSIRHPPPPSSPKCEISTLDTNLMIYGILVMQNESKHLQITFDTVMKPL